MIVYVSNGQPELEKAVVDCGLAFLWVGETDRELEKFLAENGKKLELALVDMGQWNADAARSATVLHAAGIPLVLLFCDYGRKRRKWNEFDRQMAADQDAFAASLGADVVDFPDPTRFGLAEDLRKVLSGLPSSSVLRTEEGCYCHLCKEVHPDDGSNVYIRGNGYPGSEGMDRSGVHSLKDVLGRMNPCELSNLLTEVARLATTPENRVWWAENSLGYPDAMRQSLKKIRRIALQQ